MDSIKAKPAFWITAVCCVLAFAATSAMAAGGNEEAEAFALNGSVRMIVPFSAGGGSDMAGRAIAQGLEEVIGETVTVENIVGGSGAVGYATLLAANGNPRVLLASETSLITLPLEQDVPFTFESFTPIMKLGAAYNLVIVDSEAPYKTCADIIGAEENHEDAGKHPLTVAVSGVTGPDAVSWTLIEDQFGLDFQRVPFESTAEVIAALMGGQVDVAASSPGEVIGQLKSGDVRALCALAPERYTYDALADIPTGQEQGIDATFAQWRGFIAAGDLTDAERQFWINKAKAFAKTDVFKDYIQSTMLQPQVAYGDDFSEYLADYRATLQKVLDDD